MTSIVQKPPSKTKQSPLSQPDGQDMISAGTEYFKISKAAEILDCTVDDLLHLGARGKTEIMAPIVSQGSFEWPIGSAGIPFPEIDRPFRVGFGAADRVILSTFDLSKIEAVGWTIPTFFYSPSKAKHLIDDARSVQGISSKEGEEEYFRLDEPGEPIESWTISRQSPLPEPDENEARMRAYSFNSLWHATGSVIQSEDDETNGIENSTRLHNDSSETTKVEHLFVSKEEVQRLKSGLPQDEFVAERMAQLNESALEKNINHFDRHASRREPIFKAAVYCLAQMLDRKISATTLTKMVEIEVPKLWPKESAPALVAKTIEEHLGACLAGRMDNPRSPK